MYPVSNPDGTPPVPAPNNRLMYHAFCIEPRLTITAIARTRSTTFDNRAIKTSSVLCGSRFSQARLIILK